jgi:hypothetical protein
LGEAVAKVPDADGNPRNVVAEPEAP